MDHIPAWVALLISLLLGVVVAMLVQMFIVPWQRRKVLGQSKASGKPVKFTIDGDGEYIDWVELCWGVSSAQIP